MKVSRASSFLAPCLALAVCALSSTAAAAPQGIGSVAGAVALDGTVNAGPAYSIVNVTFAVVENNAAPPATMLPWGMTAHGATGYMHENVPGNRTDSIWAVDTFGVSGNRACFSGVADAGAPLGRQRYVVCIVDGGADRSQDAFYSRWDHYGPALLSHPITAGDVTVHNY